MGWAKTRPKGYFDNLPTHSKQDVILAGPDPTQGYLTDPHQQPCKNEGGKNWFDLSLPSKPKAFLWKSSIPCPIKTLPNQILGLFDCWRSFWKRNFGEGAICPITSVNVFHIRLSLGTYIEGRSSVNISAWIMMLYFCLMYF